MRRTLDCLFCRFFRLRLFFGFEPSALTPMPLRVRSQMMAIDGIPWQAKCRLPEIIASLRFKFGDEPAKTLVLDAWNRVAVVRGAAQVISNSPWNFWAGQQTSLRIWTGLREAFLEQVKSFTDAQYKALFKQRLFQKGRFGFDPGPAWNALDVGFSLNEHTIEVESSAAVELLAAVGLQRFRPVMQDGRESFDYTTWHVPLPPAVAAAAMSGAITDSQSVRYRGCVVSRGQYAALGVSFPIREGASRE